jgi:glycerol-3-phosphate dehydrogenase
MIYDIAIIGAGVIGSLTARALSKYDVNICLIEAANDVCAGSSKANSGIVHAGFDALPGSLKAKYNVKGAHLMSDLCNDLSVKCIINGSLVLAFSEDDINTLEKLKDRGNSNGITNLTIIDKAALHELEPNISESAVAALYSPTSGIVCPYTLTIAAAESAVNNGVTLYLDSEVTGAAWTNEYWEINASDQIIKAKYVVNSAGANSEAIALLFGDHSIKIHYQKGEYILFDKTYGSLVNSVIFQPPTVHGKGVLVTPTADGNLLIGPTSHSIEIATSTETTADGMNEIIKTAAKSVPDLPLKGVLTSFTGIRASSDTGDFIVAFSDNANNLFNIAGIDSPGLTASPAIAEDVAQILSDRLNAMLNPDFNPKRTVSKPIAQLNTAERMEAVNENPLCGHIVCRCETVSEAEIIEAIKGKIPAHTIDSIKRRVRAGMGRCQGGFCGPNVAKILSRELGIPLNEILKDSKGSEILERKVNSNEILKDSKGSEILESKENSGE